MECNGIKDTKKAVVGEQILSPIFHQRDALDNIHDAPGHLCHQVNRIQPSNLRCGLISFKILPPHTTF